MTGREILLRAIRNEDTPRAPWLPFVGTHGGSLVGKTATEYLQSADALAAGILKANELYKPDGLPITFDLQMEAEILGCPLKWADEGPPSVSGHPLETMALEELPSFDTTAGRYPIVADAMARVKAEIGGEVALYGLITGPFTLAMHLMGNGIFLDMFDEPEKVSKVLELCLEVGKKAADFYIDNGADVIAVVDPMTSQISPAHFEEFVTPFLNPLFDHIRAKASYSSLFVCGDATRNLEVMAQTTCDNMSIDENISLEQLKELAAKYDKSFGGNLKLTVVLLLGTPDDARLDAIRCLDVAGTKGFILAPGCDLPYATPPENLVAVAEMAHDEYKRDVARNTLKASEVDLDSFDWPDYRQEPNVVVDVITLNSETCAPCQYMLDAVIKASERLEGAVTVREHRITTLAGLAAMKKLGVEHIPTICIDGDPKFISIIPDQDALLRAIDEKQKLRG